MNTIQYNDGWMGGQWTCKEGKPPKKIKVLINGKWFPAKAITITGVDHDHGHQYSWSNFDYLITVNSDLGKQELSLKQFATDKAISFIKE